MSARDMLALVSCPARSVDLDTTPACSRVQVSTQTSIGGNDSRFEGSVPSNLAVLLIRLETDGAVRFLRLCA